MTLREELATSGLAFVVVATILGVIIAFCVVIGPPFDPDCLKYEKKTVKVPLSPTKTWVLVDREIPVCAKWKTEK